jgi:WD40 repeat protein
MRLYSVLLASIFVFRSTCACLGGEPKERIVLPHSDSVICIAFTPDGKTLISSGNESIRLWDVASGKEKAALTRGRSSAKAVAVSPDGKLLASGNWDTTVRLWDSASGAELATLTGHTGPLLTVAFSPDGSLLASGGRDEKWEKAEVKLWDLRTRTELASLPGVADPVSRLAFSPDGKTVAVGDIRGRVFLWDVASKKVRQCLKGHTSVSGVIWSRDGRRLVSGGNDIRIWDPATGKLLATLPVGDDTDDCFGLAIAKDGKLLASGSHRGNIKIWDIATGKAALTLKQAPPKAKPTLKPIRELSKEVENDVNCVALSPDDTLLAAGVGPTVRIWDIKTLLSEKKKSAMPK